MAVVANKIDLPAAKRKVAADEGIGFQKGQQLSLHAETSAKEGTGVEKLFVDLVKNMFLQKRELWDQLPKKSEPAPAGAAAPAAAAASRTIKLDAANVQPAAAADKKKKPCC